MEGDTAHQSHMGYNVSPTTPPAPLQPSTYCSEVEATLLQPPIVDQHCANEPFVLPKSRDNVDINHGPEPVFTFPSCVVEEGYEPVYVKSNPANTDCFSFESHDQQSVEYPEIIPSEKLEVAPVPVHDEIRNGPPEAKPFETETQPDNLPSISDLGATPQTCAFSEVTLEVANLANPVQESLVQHTASGTIPVGSPCFHRDTNAVEQVGDARVGPAMQETAQTILPEDAVIRFQDQAFSALDEKTIMQDPTMLAGEAPMCISPPKEQPTTTASGAQVAIPDQVAGNSKIINGGQHQFTDQEVILNSSSNPEPSQPRADPSGQSEELEAEQDFSGEPLESRFESKELNRRCSAYVEISEKMASSLDVEAFDLFKKHLNTCLGETLPKGQDAALHALKVYLEKCPGIGNEAGDVLPLVRKFIEHKMIDKPKMQQLVPPVLMLVAEICECPNVMREVKDCLSELESAKKKTQGFFKKQVAFIIKLIYHLLADFGVHKMNPNLGYISMVLKYITDSDRNLRETCYSVLVELSAWMGDISEATKLMEEPQKKELAKRVTGLSEEETTRKEAKRMYRGEKPNTKDGQKQKPLRLDATDVQGEASPAIDEYESAEAMDAFKKLPKGWSIDKIFTMGKWAEKQKHLNALAEVVDVIRLLPCDSYGGLVPGFQRLLKNESNIPVVAEAAKCVGLMAKGLRRGFEKPARQLLPIFLARITDRSVWNPRVLIERVEQMLWAVPFEVFLEEMRPYVASKSLFAKKEAMNFLLRALDLPSVLQSYPDAAQKLLPTLATIILPNMDDSDNTVRQEAARFLAVLVQRNALLPSIGSLVVEKVPVHRRAVFEEEWRKLTNDQPIPRGTNVAEDKAKVVTVATKKAATFTAGVAPSQKRCGSLKELDCSSVSEGNRGSRHASPVPKRTTMESPSKMRQPTPPKRSTMESPSRLRQRSPAKGGLHPQSTEARSYTPLRVRSLSREKYESQQEEGGAQETSLVKIMAEEIKSLRSAVARLERNYDHDAAPPSRLRTPSVGSTSMLRPPSPREVESNQISTLRPPSPRAAESARTSMLRPPSPREAAPTRTMTPPPQARCKSVGRAATPRVEQENRTERRSSTMSGCASPTTTRRKGVRISNSEAQLHQTNSTHSLRRDRSTPVFPVYPRLQIEHPKQAKQTRQSRERNQYWGPDTIPAEHLLAFKESWKICVDERLCRNMFSEKMDEQIFALQNWRHQIMEYFDSIPEILDMILKWLSWMLFNTNTQIWKQVLDVLNVLLDKMIAADIQFTEREAQILVPNLLEKSGHNITSIRESMMSILKQLPSVCPRARIFPMLLHGLSSKNKRSVACALRIIGDVLDRQIVVSLVRSNKDIGAVLKLLDERDTDVRRLAVHVTASLSQYVDSEAFAKICKGLPACTQQSVRSTAARLPPLPSKDASQDGSFLNTSATDTSSNHANVTPAYQTGGCTVGNRTPRVPERRALEVSCGGVQSEAHVPQPDSPKPKYRRSTSGSSIGDQSPIAKSHGQLVTPRLSAGQVVPNATAAAVSQDARATCGQLDTATACELAQQLVHCNGKDFKGLCSTLKRRMKQQVTEADAVLLAEALVPAMRMYLGHDGCADQCRPLVEVLDEFCASKECLRPLPAELLRGILREQLRNLHNSSWTRHMDDGAMVLRTLNLSCVMLLNGITRPCAYSLLLDLGTNESEVVATSLMIKCLRKLNKSLSTSRTPEVEIPKVLDVLMHWLRRVQPRLLQLPAIVCTKGIVDTAVCAVMEGVREVADAAQLACPSAATSWIRQLEDEDAKLLQDWLLLNKSGTWVSKENLPTTDGQVGVVGQNTAGSDLKSGSRVAPLQRRVSSPAKLGTPCTPRNSLQ